VSYVRMLEDGYGATEDTSTPPTDIPEIEQRPSTAADLLATATSPVIETSPNSSTDLVVPLLLAGGAIALFWGTIVGSQEARR
jgi:hypothetical protein